MASLNRVTLIGNLGKDPEVKYIGSGDAVCNFSIATSESWKDKDGNKQEHTEWHNVQCWRKLAEIVGEYLQKGDSVYIEGKLKTRKYDKDGQTHYATDVVADRIQFLKTKGKEGNDSSGGEESSSRSRRGASKPAAGGDDFDDDIPF